MRVTKLVPMILAVFALLAVGVASTSAKSRDRNHDGIADSWERSFHLSLKANQARRDQDRDGLRNRAEFRFGMSPRDADSDDDGVKDSAENSGKIVSFENNVLKIDLVNGESISGTVTDSTRIRCAASDTTTTTGAVVSHNGGGDDNSGPGNNDSEDGIPGRSDHDGQDHNEDGHGDAGRGNDDGPCHDGTPCTTTSLVAGAAVHEAELKTTSAGLVYTEVKLGK